MFRSWKVEEDLTLSPDWEAALYGPKPAEVVDIAATPPVGGFIES